jgi:3,4-dihydroxy 2-butanone 4-phosphate synthase/GTP cyclohydrolase II
MGFAKIEEALEALKRGEMIVIVDDEDRENEGDVMVAAQFVTPEKINFMAKEARGIICVPMTGERLDELGIKLMVQTDTSGKGCAFTVSVDAREGRDVRVRSRPDDQNAHRPQDQALRSRPAGARLPVAG